jgi:hypothetical protein
MKPAHTYRVTHVDAQGHRRTAVLACALRSAAEALATAMWGEAQYMAAMRLPGGSVQPRAAGQA